MNVFDKIGTSVYEIMHHKELMAEKAEYDRQNRIKSLRRLRDVLMMLETFRSSGFKKWLESLEIQAKNLNTEIIQDLCHNEKELGKALGQLGLLTNIFNLEKKYSEEAVNLRKQNEQYLDEVKKSIKEGKKNA